jgi:hypothetical protein
MSKRKVTITIEYESDGKTESLWSVINNLKRILSEDMPYVKVTSIQDAPRQES